VLRQQDSHMLLNPARLHPALYYLLMVGLAIIVAGAYFVLERPTSNALVRIAGIGLFACPDVAISSNSRQGEARPRDL
jgi:hypothetical protein